MNPIAHRIEAIITAQASNFAFTIEDNTGANPYESAGLEKIWRSAFHQATGAAETHRMLIGNSLADGIALGAWEEILSGIYEKPTTRAELRTGEWIEEQEQAFLKVLNDGTLRELIDSKVKEAVAKYEKLRAAEERAIAEDQH
ncbi:MULTISPECIES: hypothetical protein [Corynebacterium]|uniref:Uncharacterized protein n=1 Tax=Corynebacterium ihumii TaxID=1232427 RepID=A0ABY7UAK6_9CORY|nr:MULTISPECIES: hypothetical protein [Corynebacterium]WCZ33676.1 hypothetical protein CIHUM_01145 [Corynebacterium ihumii]